MVSHQQECVDNYINCFSWVGGYPHFKWLYRIFSRIFIISLFSKIQITCFGGLVYCFSNELGCHMPCESLDGFWKTRAHSRAHNDFHMSTFPSRDVTSSLEYPSISLGSENSVSILSGPSASFLKKKAIPLISYVVSYMCRHYFCLSQHQFQARRLPGSHPPFTTKKTP